MQKTHVCAICGQTSQKSSHRFAQTRRSQCPGWPEESKAQTALCVAGYTSHVPHCWPIVLQQTSCKQREQLVNNSLCALPVVLQPLCLSAGRVICTTTSQSPNAAGNKGSLFAAVYPKDIERDAGGGGEITVVGDPTQQGPSSRSRGTSRQGGLGTRSHVPGLSAGSVPLTTKPSPSLLRS